MVLAAVLLSAVLYLAPGLSLLSLLDLGRVPLGRRLFAGLCVSLVVVPYGYLTASLIGHVTPHPIHVALFSLAVVLTGLVLRWRTLRPRISWTPAVSKPSKFESFAVWVFLVAFAAIANIPRLDMFLAGGATRSIPLFDGTWHLAQLVSVARSGIPPDHYLFPTAQLAHYYGGWIYPAVIGNASPGLSLARAMAIYSWVVAFAFAGLAYCVLQRLVRTAPARLLGISFFTILGGLDLFASLPSISQIDWWQARAGWLVSHQQISQWITLYEWVPHHLFAGALFLMGMWLWTSLADRSVLRNAAVAALLGLSFSISPFVFAGNALAVSIVLFHARRSLAEGVRRAPRVAFALAALLIVCVAVPTLPVAGVYLRHESVISLSDWRVPLVEALRGGQTVYAPLDKALTILGLPIIGPIVGFIELGAPILLYAAWWIVRAYRRPVALWTPLDALIALQPPTFFLVTVLVLDSVGTLSMRGLIPSQILVCLASALMLEQATPLLSTNKVRRSGAIYLLAIFVVAQGASTAAEWRDNSASLLKWMWNGRPGERVFPYIEWLNANSPIEALILEQGCPDVDSQEYRWLERRRLTLPECVATMGYFERDRDYTLLSEWRAYRQVATRAGGSTLELLGLLDIPGKDTLPVYEVVWPEQPLPSTGTLVYADATVKVFRIH